MALKCFRRLVLVGCLSEVLRLMASRWDCEVTLDEGVPGCGKTNFIKQKANLEQTLILTPGRINCEEFVSAGYVGQTADSFVVKNGYAGQPVSTVWVDGALLGHPGIIK